MTKVSEVPQYLRASEVARHYRVQVVTVFSWMKRGVLKGFKVGGAVRILSSEIEDFDPRHLDENQ